MRYYFVLISVWVF